MVQVTPPSSAPTNASLPGLVNPARPEQSRTSGVRSSSVDDVSQADEDYEVQAQDERRDREVYRAQRDVRVKNDSRGQNLDILV